MTFFTFGDARSQASHSSAGASIDRLWAAGMALSAVPLIALLPGALPLLQGLGEGLTPWRAVFDLIAMLTCGVIAAIAWNARALEVPPSIYVLGAACAGALMLDFAHALTSPGVPGLGNAEATGRSTLLCMASCLLVALAILCVAAVRWRLDERPAWLRWVPMAVATYVLLTLGTAFGWPREASGSALDASLRGALKQAAEGLWVAVLLAASLLFCRRLRGGQAFDARSLASAALLMAMGGLAVMRSSRASDLPQLLGHAYKVAGFWMVYRTIATDSMRAPYQRLLDSRQRLRQNEEELRTITDNIPALVAFVDCEQRYRFVNRNYLRWLGLEPAAMIGRTAQEIFGADHYAALQPHIERALEGHTFAVEHRINGIEFARGRWLNIMYMPKVASDGSVGGVYILSSDITEVMVAERRARFLAEHDELTTLPNRAAFQAAVARALEQSACDMSHFAVIFVDVDRRRRATGPMRPPN